MHEYTCVCTRIVIKAVEYCEGGAGTSAFNSCYLGAPIPTTCMSLLTVQSLLYYHFYPINITGPLTQARWSCFVSSIGHNDLLFSADRCTSSSTVGLVSLPRTSTDGRSFPTVLSSDVRARHDIGAVVSWSIKTITGSIGTRDRHVSLILTPFLSFGSSLGDLLLPRAAGLTRIRHCCRDHHHPALPTVSGNEQRHVPFRRSCGT